MGPVQEMIVKKEMPLEEFMRLFLVDDDLGLRFVRIIDTGACVVTITPEPPDFKDKLRIRMEAII